jgi:hypothetical protein
VSGTRQRQNNPDFPLSIDVFDDMPMAEAEQWERERWKRGVDVEALYLDIKEPQNVNIMI